MKRKVRFCSLNRTIMIFGILLSCFLLGFCLIFWGSSSYLMRQQSRLLNVQQQFSALVNGLHEADSNLYTYAQERNENLKKKCSAILDEIKNAVSELSVFLEQPIFVDLEYLVEAYRQSAENVLNAEEVGTGQFLMLYQEAADDKEIIDSLMEQYNTAVNIDCAQKQQNLQKVQQTIEYAMVVSTVILAVICLLFLTGFSKRITQNLVLLTKRAQRICKGDWNVDVEGDTEIKDEVGVLTTAFYTMLETIKQQIEQLKRQEAMKRQLKEAEIQAVHMKARLEHAQLRTLQSRVNPHFLFNALNVIGGQAAEEKAEKTLDMIFKTADYLRYSLSKLDKTVTLKEELENVEDYFIIQKRRFGDRIQFSIQCEEACEKAKIPAMILQPLCENALIHGVMAMTDGAQIRVEACLLEKKVCIAVIDNGIGFSKERLSEIQQRLKNENYDDTQGIGLYNIMQRLHAFFHQEAECRIESIPEVKTKVMLYFPVCWNTKKEEEEGEYGKSSIGG